MGKDKKEIPADIQKLIDEGKAFAIDVPKPSISARAATIAMALLVAAACLPFWLAPSTFMYLCAIGGAMGWLILFRVEAAKLAERRALAAVDYKISSLVISRLKQELDSKGNLDDKSNGTNEAE